MAVSIVFLGPLRDLADETLLEVSAPLDWSGLLKVVGPDLAVQLRGNKVNVACAGRVLSDKTALEARDGDEVALLPPVSGG